MLDNKVYLFKAMFECEIRLEKRFLWASAAAESTASINDIGGVGLDTHANNKHSTKCNQIVKHRTTSYHTLQYVTCKRTGAWFWRFDRAGEPFWHFTTFRTSPARFHLILQRHRSTGLLSVYLSEPNW